MGNFKHLKKEREWFSPKTASCITDDPEEEKKAADNAFVFALIM